uniref:Uncharacterized protein n=1 Tax=Plectus sambesii TaxID=2011161 RepID=A0A914UKH6_9BILA
MPIFGENSSPYDEVVEKATAETVTSENWGLILDICDRVTGEGSKGAKQCLLSIKKRLNHRDPHVVMLALSVLDSLWNNSGTVFQREVSSREFTSELLSKATHSNRSIGEKTRLLIKKWADNECKKDPSLSLVETLYIQLERDGYSFESSEPKKTAMKLPTDPNFVTTNEEEEAIAKAIALSLKENDAKAGEPAKVNKTSIYPTAAPAASGRTVKALYDFEAVEDNELTFFTGDVISVLDD